LLVKLPAPLSSDVCDPEIAGLEVVPQHTPRAVTAAPPSFEIIPPVVPELTVIFVTVVVVKVGITSSFLQLSIIAIPINKQTKTKRGTIFFILTIINYLLINLIISYFLK
jgi:hypothetical protein